MKACIFYLFLLVFLTGCTTSQLPILPLQNVNKTPVHNDQHKNFHWYTEQLARQLFDTADSLNRNMTVIVGTPLPSKTLSPETNTSLDAYGIQLQESLVTLCTQAGLKVIEFKTMPNIETLDNTDLVLSRDSKKLNKNIHAQFVIAGTYTEQEHDLVVNIRLIRLSDSSIVAAATDTIPLNTIWSTQKIKLRTDKLYRDTY